MPAGSKPGERRGGRKAGTPNKTTVQAKARISDLAKRYAPAALRVLNEIATSEKASDAARVSAANSILDRAYGKSPQPISGDGDSGPVKVIIAAADAALL